MRIHVSELTGRATSLVVAWAAVLLKALVFAIWPRLQIDESRIRFGDQTGFSDVRQVPALITLLVYGAALVASARVVFGLANAADNTTGYLIGIDRHLKEFKERERAASRVNPATVTSSRAAEPIRLTE